MSEGRWSIAMTRVAEVDPKTLTPHPRNPKIHTAAQDAVVEASLRRFGWLERLMVNEVTGHVLNGHERLELALVRGEATVPVGYVRVPEELEGEVLLTLDPSGQLWRTHQERWVSLQREVKASDPALMAFWAQLAAQEGIDMAGAPAASDTSAMPGGSGAYAAGEEVEERGAALQRQWGTALGQCWQCGEHYVVCGDSTQPGTWEVIRDRVGLVQGGITSPPYAEQRAKAYGGIPAGEYVAWFRPMARQVWQVLDAEASLFVNLKEHSEEVARPPYVHELVYRLVAEDGWTYLDEFCWERAGVPGDPVTRGKFKNMWEPVFWFAKQARPRFYPERAKHRSDKALIDTHWQPGLDTMQGSGRDYLGPKERRGPGWAYPGNRLPTFGNAEALGQPAAFPIGLPQWFLEVYSEPGDWWVDPFGGSGTVLMACEATARKAVLIERDPRYSAITLERYRAATDEQPTRIT